MADIFNSLSRFSWRGNEWPCLNRTVERNHEQVNHPLIYKDGELLEGTGLKNWTFTYTLPFRQGIFKGPPEWSNLYSEGLIERFLPTYLDRTHGELIDPFYGVFQCKPMTFKSSIDVRRRDGEDVVVKFEHSPDQDTSEEIAGELASVEAIDQRSAYMDAVINVALIEADIPDLPTLVNPLDVITGIGDQLLLQGDLLAAKFDSLAFRAEKLESTINELAQPENAPIIRSLRRLRTASGRLQQTAINPRKDITITVPIPQDMTLTDFAAIYNMTLADLQRLNPGIGLYLKQGQTLKVYPSASPV